MRPRLKRLVQLLTRLQRLGTSSDLAEALAIAKEVLKEWDYDPTHRNS